MEIVRDKPHSLSLGAHLGCLINGRVRYRMRDGELEKTTTF